MAEATDVVVGVITDAMPFVDHTLEDVGVFAHVVAHHEEGRLDTIPSQHVQDEWRGFGDGPVVESQIDGLLLRVHTP